MLRKTIPVNMFWDRQFNIVLVWDSFFSMVIESVIKLKHILHLDNGQI